MPLIIPDEKSERKIILSERIKERNKATQTYMDQIHQFLSAAFESSEFMGVVSDTDRMRFYDEIACQLFLCVSLDSVDVLQSITGIVAQGSSRKSIQLSEKDIQMFHALLENFKRTIFPKPPAQHPLLQQPTFNARGDQKDLPVGVSSAVPQPGGSVPPELYLNPVFVTAESVQHPMDDDGPVLPTAVTRPENRLALFQASFAKIQERADQLDKDIVRRFIQLPGDIKNLKMLLLAKKIKNEKWDQVIPEEVAMLNSDDQKLVAETKSSSPADEKQQSAAKKIKPNAKLIELGDRLLKSINDDSYARQFRGETLDQIQSRIYHLQAEQQALDQRLDGVEGIQRLECGTTFSAAVVHQDTVDLAYIGDNRTYAIYIDDETHSMTHVDEVTAVQHNTANRTELERVKKSSQGSDHYLLRVEDKNFLHFANQYGLTTRTHGLGDNVLPASFGFSHDFEVVNYTINPKKLPKKGRVLLLTVSADMKFEPHPQYIALLNKAFLKFNKRYQSAAQDSSDSDEEEASDSYASGFCDFLVKPLIASQSKPDQDSNWRGKRTYLTASAVELARVTEGKPTYTTTYKQSLYTTFAEGFGTIHIDSLSYLAGPIFEKTQKEMTEALQEIARLIGHDAQSDFHHLGKDLEQRWQDANQIGRQGGWKNILLAQKLRDGVIKMTQATRYLTEKQMVLEQNDYIPSKKTPVRPSEYRQIGTEDPIHIPQATYYGGFVEPEYQLRYFQTLREAERLLMEAGKENDQNEYSFLFPRALNLLSQVASTIALPEVAALRESNSLELQKLGNMIEEHWRSAAVKWNNSCKDGQADLQRYLALQEFRDAILKTTHVTELVRTNAHKEDIKEAFQKAKKADESLTDFRRWIPELSLRTILEAIVFIIPEIIAMVASRAFGNRRYHFPFWGVMGAPVTDSQSKHQEEMRVLDGIVSASRLGN